MSVSEQQVAPQLAPVLAPLPLPESLLRPDFTFDPERHVYHLAGERLRGVSTVVKQYSKPFDEDHWSKVIAGRRGITQDQVLSEWAAERDRANRVGTTVHAGIEHLLAHGELPSCEQVTASVANQAEAADAWKRIQRFEGFRKGRLGRLTPRALELRVFSEEFGLAGTLDGLFEFGGRLFVGDWKTNKEWTAWGFMLPPFDRYAGSHLARYSLQVSLYRLMLAEHGLPTAGGFLCHLRPDGAINLEQAFDMRQLARLALGKSST